MGHRKRPSGSSEAPIAEKVDPVIRSRRRQRCIYARSRCHTYLDCASMKVLLEQLVIRQHAKPSSLFIRASHATSPCSLTLPHLTADVSVPEQARTHRLE
jgi:hypothetical protein